MVAQPIAEPRPDLRVMPASRALLYARVSTVEQSHGYSLPTQIESCRRWCADRGADVVAEFSDAHSGTELDRPGLNAAIDACRELRPDAVVLLDVDRLGRDPAVLAIAERELTRYGAKLVYVNGGDSGTGDGQLLNDIKAALAKYENFQRNERSRRGKHGRVKDGHPIVGPRPPYGYAYVGGERTGALVPREDEAAVVRQMFALACDGLSRQAIAQHLTAQGLPTRADAPDSIIHKRRGRGVWNPHTIIDILKSETYRGVWHYGKTRRVARTDGREGKVQVPKPRGEWLSAAVPPLVDDATWHRAQEQLAKHHRPVRPGECDYLLSGRVICECGRRWVGHYKRDRGYARYHCPVSPSQSWERPCSMRFGVRQDDMEGAVLGAVEAFLKDPEVRRTALREERERVAAERERLAADVAEIDRTLTRVDRQLGKLLDDALADLFPADQIAERTRSLAAERERLLADRERRLIDLDPPAVDVEAEIAALAPKVETAFANLTPAEVREILDLLRVEAHVIDRATVRLTGVMGTVVAALC
jgi:site-specific DNA recombinase